MITIKTPEEQDKMRVAGRLAAQVLDMIAPHVQCGIATEELDRLCHEYIVGELGSIPAPLNYRGSAGAAPFCGTSSTPDAVMWNSPPRFLARRRRT